MEKHRARARDARIAVRVSADDQREIEETAKTRGYHSPSAFIRSAIRNELHGREELTGIEERISGSFEQLSKENVQLSRAVQALFALVEALSKTVLTCLPQPPAEARSQAIALAKERYHRLIQSAAAGMSGNSRAVLDLLDHDRPIRIRPRKPPVAHREDAAWSGAYRLVMHYARGMGKLHNASGTGRTSGGKSYHQRCAVRVTYLNNRTRGQWKAHGAILPVRARRRATVMRCNSVVIVSASKSPANSNAGNHQAIQGFGR